MRLLRILIGYFNRWVDRQTELGRLLFLMTSITVGLLSSTIGVHLKSHPLLLIGMLSLIFGITPSVTKSLELGYKDTAHVILILIATVFLATLILSIFL